MGGWQDNIETSWKNKIVCDWLRDSLASPHECMNPPPHSPHPPSHHPPPTTHLVYLDARDGRGEAVSRKAFSHVRRHQLQNLTVQARPHLFINTSSRISISSSIEIIIMTGYDVSFKTTTRQASKQTVSPCFALPYRISLQHI